MHDNINELGKAIVEVFKIETSIMSSQTKNVLPSNLVRKATFNTKCPHLPCFANSISLNGGSSLHIIIIYTLSTHLLQKCLIFLQAVK